MQGNKMPLKGYKMNEEHQGLHIKFNFMNKRVSEIEKKIDILMAKIDALGDKDKKRMV